MSLILNSIVGLL